ncbi:MAG: hypothetical protein E5W82_04875 [Mesorhizobium sp.]|nr:MAG: hypothetical protein E5W82_04875 [Mesorhizobium sp.]
MASAARLFLLSFGYPNEDVSSRPALASMSLRRSASGWSAGEKFVAPEKLTFTQTSIFAIPT